MTQEIISQITTELDQPTRNYLLGKPATVRDWCLKVVELTVGNPQKRIVGKNLTEIGTMLGISRQWVANYIKLALKHKLADVDPENPEKIKVYEKTQQEIFQEYSEQFPIMQDPLVIEWDRNMAFRKKGKPIEARAQHIRNLQKFCNFFKVKPVQLIQDRNTTGSYLETYLEKLRDGTIPRRIRNDKSSPEQAFKAVKDAVRHFCSYHGISLPKGLGGIWDARVLGHGQYADIRLSDQQLIQLDKLMLEWYGMDSNIYRLVWAGIESGARKEALLSMKLDWTESVDEDGSVTFYLTAYESKTKHIKDGKWTKYITRKNTQESLRLLKARNSTDVLYENETKPKMYKILVRELKKLYKALGLTNQYFYDHAVHALRHISAHYWLAHTNYDYEYVCIVCGWHTNAELKASYGEMPPEIITAKMKQYRKAMIGAVAA